MTLPVARIEWKPCWRIIPSRFPPIQLFERVTDPDDLEAVFELDALTNPRLRDEAGDIELVPPKDRISGPATTIIMAAFTHLNPNGSLQSPIYLTGNPVRLTGNPASDDRRTGPGYRWVHMGSTRAARIVLATVQVCDPGSSFRLCRVTAEGRGNVNTKVFRQSWGPDKDPLVVVRSGPHRDAWPHAEGAIASSPDDARSGSGIARLVDGREGVLLASGLSGQGDFVSVVDDAVEDGVGDCSFSEESMPGRDRQL